MPTFQCRMCGRKSDTDYEICDCTHSHNCHEQKKPICCGHEMLEMMDDQSILPFLHRFGKRLPLLSNTGAWWRLRLN